MTEMRLIDANALDLQNRVATDMGGMCFIEDVETAIEQAPTIDPESLRPAWIPVTERLPLVELEGIKDSEVYHCLVCVNPIVRQNEGYVQEAWFIFADGEFKDYDGINISRSVTHWMPMPEPPEE